MWCVVVCLYEDQLVVSVIVLCCVLVLFVYEVDHPLVLGLPSPGLYVVVWVLFRTFFFLFSSSYFFPFLFSSFRDLFLLSAPLVLLPC